MALHDKGEKDLCNEDPCYMVRQEDLCLLFVVVMGAMAVGLVGLVARYLVNLLVIVLLQIIGDLLDGLLVLFIVHSSAPFPFVCVLAQQGNLWTPACAD